MIYIEDWRTRYKLHPGWHLSDKKDEEEVNISFDNGNLIIDKVKIMKIKVKSKKPTNPGKKVRTNLTAANELDNLPTPPKGKKKKTRHFNK